MSTRRLRELMRSAAQPNMTPIELAHQAAKQIPPQDIPDLLGDLLVPIARDVLRDITPPPDKPAPHAQPTPRPPSPKLEQRRNWWNDMLANRVHIGNGAQKVLADCTIDDLTFCIKERESTIEKLDTQLRNYRQLINLMLKHGAYTVSGLPEQRTWETT